MKAITFYSYKGGVGRSLALSNIATRLSDLNQKVVVLDFDLEAPGLQFKFPKYEKGKIDQGIVDYISDFEKEGKAIKLKNYAVELKPHNRNSNKMFLIPAGNINSDLYWQKLSLINWSNLFYKEDGYGVRFFLDFKERIKKEFNPDFLLIDSRTGITDIAGVTLRLLADKVVILAANNDENRDGSIRILRSLLEPENDLFEHTPKLHYVLTRIPFTDKPIDRHKEEVLLLGLNKELKYKFPDAEIPVSVIHSDRRLEEKEQNFMGIEREDGVISIENDYLELFEKLIAEDLNSYEMIEFKNKKKAEFLYNQALSEVKYYKRIELLTEAISLNPKESDYYFQRGLAYHNNEDYNKSNDDYFTSLTLNPDSWYVYNNIGVNHEKMGNYELALECSNKAFSLVRNPTTYVNIIEILIKLGQTNLAKQKLADTEYDLIDSADFNLRAKLYRLLGEFDKALEDAYKAIELNPNEGTYYGTLAEIKYLMKNKDEFYINLIAALEKKITAKQMNASKNIYEEVKDEPRFLEILKRNKIDIDEVLK